MEKVLSIVIPSYNISKYIDEILPSYIDENAFGLVDVLLIDDGATDDTAQKAKKYVEKYPDYFHFYHKENGGHGSVINYAWKFLIKTKYFMVIDGDDWVYPKALCSLANHLQKEDTDLVITDCSYEYNDHQTISYGIRKNNNELNLRIHKVVYKTDLFKKNNILLREKVFYEDSQYVLFPLEYVKAYSYYPWVVARYRQDDPYQSVNPIVQQKRKNQYEIVLNDLLLFSNKIQVQNSVLPELKEYINDSIARIMFGAFELNWSYLAKTKKAIHDCRVLQHEYKKYPAIYKLMKNKYKRFKQMSFLNFNGIRVARLLHKNK